MTDFHYEPLLRRGADDTSYRLVSSDHVSRFEAGGGTFLEVEPEGAHAC